MPGEPDELVWSPECDEQGHVHPDCDQRRYYNGGSPAYESFLRTRGPLNPRRVASLR